MKSMSVDAVAILIRDPSERERIIKRMVTQSSRYRLGGIEGLVDKRIIRRVSESAVGRVHIVERGTTRVRKEAV